MNKMVSGSLASVEPVEAAQVRIVEGLVKWFEVGKGFGFIIPSDGSPDVLLHLSTLKRDGFKPPPEGANITCDVVMRPKGLQCLRVLAIDLSTAIHPVERAPRALHGAPITPISGWMRGTVKWFDRAKGFGFVVVDNLGGDVFLHMEILRSSKVATAPESGQVIFVKHGGCSDGRLMATHACLKLPE